ncbi:MAG: hypothetical protein IPK12_13435 [Gemmatimonadetes bacterium]|nr:hypothetical protein [Gemmatimonadota bacterium]
MILLGALTVRYLWRALHLDWAALHLVPGVAGAVGLGLLAAGARWVVPGGWPVLARLAVGGVVTGSLTLVYLYLLRRVGVRWVTEIEARLIRRPAAA